MLKVIQKWSGSHQSLGATSFKLALHEVDNLHTSTLVAPFANGP